VEGKFGGFKMTNQTYVCLECKKSFRQTPGRGDFRCPHCKNKCIAVHYKIRIPSPKRVREWDKFWEKYLKEIRLLEDFLNDPSVKFVKLDIYNQKWVKLS
jgi:DNA-directed RNA polymerase subunit RPC12/RpoP